MRALRTIVAAVAVLVPTVAGPTPASGAVADGCEVPEVNVLASTEAAVSRPALQSPAEYGLSNIYAQNELATKPQFVYSEAGPQFAGPFEALAPAGSPPPPRAVAAYPSEDIPDDVEEDWGGRSRAAVTPVSAFATSTGTPPLGAGVTIDSATSYATTVVECDTVTIIAGWSAVGVVAPDGTSFSQIGETVTLVVGPEGSSADVTVTAVAVDGTSLLPIAGRPLDPISDPTRENGGPTVEVGEPRTVTEPGHASASGGGFNFLFADPETGQGAGYRIGSVNAAIDVLGALAPAAPVAGERASVQPVVDASVASAPVTTRVVGTSSSMVGRPPVPSAAALETIETILVRDVETIVLQVSGRDWSPLVGLFAAVLAALFAAGGVAVGRDRFPTLDWIARRTLRGTTRFASQYLRW